MNRHLLISQMQDWRRWSGGFTRFGKGHENFRVAKDERVYVRVKPCRNTCPQCGAESGRKQCIDTYEMCVGCQGWW